MKKYLKNLIQNSTLKKEMNEMYKLRRWNYGKPFAIIRENRTKATIWTQDMGWQTWDIEDLKASSHNINLNDENIEIKKFVEQLQNCN